MSSLERADVARLAALARIDMTDADLDRLSGQLSAIVDAVATLEEGQALALFSQVGEQVVGRSLNIQPTITIRPGFPVRVLVTHDLVLEPYRG